MKLTTHLHLVSKSIIRGSVPILPNTPSWHGAELKKKGQAQLYFYLTSKDISPSPNIGCSGIIPVSYSEGLGFESQLKQVSITEVLRGFPPSLQSNASIPTYREAKKTSSRGRDNSAVQRWTTGWVFRGSSPERG
jgi:hypothetical protein